MGVFEKQAQRATKVKRDEFYVAYGKPGTGKTVIGATFPGTKEIPQCYLDIMEGGTDSIPHEDREKIVVVKVNSLPELKEVITDIMRGYAMTEEGKRIHLNFSSLTMDSVTQLEGLVKMALMEEHSQKQMTIPMWTKLKQIFEELFNLLKEINIKLGIPVLVIAHEKEQRDDNNPGFNRLIPSLTSSISSSLCAKASYVWYTNIEKKTTINPETHDAVESLQYTTTIDGHPYLNSKCRKPPTAVIPQKMVNLTYDKFQEEIVSLISKKKEE